MAIFIVNNSVDIKIDNQIDNSIERYYRGLNGTTPLFPFWSFSNPVGKTLTTFMVVFESGQVTADWGDGSSQILTSSVNYNKTFS